MSDRQITATGQIATANSPPDQPGGIASHFLQVLELPADHPALAGHFPGRPIMPGVVLLDHTVLALRRWLGDSVAAMSCEIASAKFLSPVSPGDPLELDASHTRTASEHSVRFDIRSGARRIASGVVRFKHR